MIDLVSWVGPNAVDGRDHILRLSVAAISGTAAAAIPQHTAPKLVGYNEVTLKSESKTDNHQPTRRSRSLLHVGLTHAQNAVTRLESRECEYDAFIPQMVESRIPSEVDEKGGTP